MVMLSYLKENEMIKTRMKTPPLDQTGGRKDGNLGSSFGLTAFSDAAHVGCIDSRKKVEYVALSASCAQVMWMRIQLQDYGFNYNKIPLYCDSQTEYQLANMFTKALTEDRFKYLVRRISMRCLNPSELEVLAKESA
uniref:Retrovirus-related Pol polyprotein from transposon TNT 1-94 n=1 Tax=Tanacetum cinerariifolium TaxID=118510 RepID=A0A6L2MBF7_TANCI|nr:hypothetical protein [Tanacetum cinerariifolium]